MKFILTISFLVSSLAYAADCTYRLGDPAVVKLMTPELIQSFELDSGYILDENSPNVLTIQHLGSRKAFPLVNLRAIPDTVFMGMTERKTDYKLNLKASDAQEISSVKFSVRSFGDEYSKADGLHKKSTAKNFKKALGKIAECE